MVKGEEGVERRGVRLVAQGRDGGLAHALALAVQAARDPGDDFLVAQSRGALEGERNRLSATEALGGIRKSGVQAKMRDPAKMLGTLRIAFTQKRALANGFGA